MNDVLHADCSLCAGLCCVALAFDRSAEFAFEKAAGEACRHLLENCQCGIHAHLTGSGFSGCARYDCLGAGQRVTQELFLGRSWRAEPDLKRPMLEAFRILRRVHELRQLLEVAAGLPLPPATDRERVGLLAEMEPPGGWSLATLIAFERGRVPRAVELFLVSLRGLARSERLARAQAAAIDR